ncbi:hypothetical protein DENSPDRAFT_756115, partial [Dentipellis sp. KUC8613]
DYYTLLGIPRTADAGTVKRAYHAFLLRSHPDRQHSASPASASASNSPSPAPAGAGSVDIGRAKEAYRVLSTPALRTQYDAELVRERKAAGPRPANVISLEEFEEDGSGEVLVWTHPCRCGGTYRVSEADLETGRHLVGCGSCSEVVWVGFEVVEDE